ncbi:MAG: DNA repair protein RadB [Candidatus Altiarchaeales archaeon HGW-Altiarchaeales-2]|nr:MAG: DNA repair protein RadB [Candidatus Altiarchaeales archaeon HGW-Altiarchaeales-2]
MKFNTMLNIEKNFDEILGGGILEKCLTQIYGPPASGKTNLCIIAAVYVALKEKKIIFIDTEGGFSVGIEKMVNEKIGLVVVDSITMLYRLEEADSIDKRQERQILLGKQLEILLRISRKFNIPVIITNQVYTDIETNEISPVGGEILKYWSKVIVELGRENLNSTNRFAVMKKHKFIKEGEKILFKIVEEGIVVEK